MSRARRRRSTEPEVPAAEIARDEEVAGYRCPACGETLYGWVAAHDPIDRSRIVLDHCEGCGLVVTRAPKPPDVAAELALLDRHRGRIVVPNRASFQGGIGGAQWAGLEPDRRRLHLNPRAAKLLLRQVGVEVLAGSTSFGRDSYLGMLQTLINAFTLRDNFARNAFAGRLPRESGRQKLSFALDAFVTAVVSIPIAIVSLPLELIGSLARRGGTMRLQTVQDPPTPDLD